MIEFFMPMIPPSTTAQMHKVMVKNGKPVFYDPPKVKAAREKLLSHLYVHKPNKPFDTGVRLIVRWCFPSQRRQRDGEYKITRPDTDNLQKLLKDCMTECGFWKDDALVCSELCEKFWANIPGIYVRIEAV